MSFSPGHKDATSMNPLYSKRTLYLALDILALFCTLALTSIAYAQSQDKPGAPENLTVSSGDTEATISWDAPESVGEGNTCSPTDYEVWVERVSDGDRTWGSEVLSPWKATGLDPSTAYEVEIYTYSASCDDYSAEPATATFTTAAADQGDAAEPEEKHAPKRVRRLRAEPAQGEGEGQTGDSALLAWNAPSTKNGKHYAATDYAVKVIRVADNGEKTQVQLTEEITATEHTVEGLVAGDYRFRVAAYSGDCNCYGRWRSVKYTHE